MREESDAGKRKVRFKTSNTKNVDAGWVVKTIVITFTMSGVFNLLSNGVMEVASIWVACLVLFAIIFTGIVFDIIGVAVTTADEPPFHSMAAQRISGADKAIALIRAKDKVSNICNDVVGDICGIISGSASAAVVAFMLTVNPGINSFFLSLVMTAFVASLTVGGKAMGKSVAMKFSNQIVYSVARIMSVFGSKR